MTKENFFAVHERLRKSGLKPIPRAVLSALMTSTLPGSTTSYAKLSELCVLAVVAPPTFLRAFSWLVSNGLVGIESGDGNRKIRFVIEPRVLSLGDVTEGEPLFLDAPRRSHKKAPAPATTPPAPPAPSEAPSEATPAQREEGIPDDLIAPAPPAPAISNKAEALEHLSNVAARLDDDYECSARDDGAPLTPQVEPAPIAVTVEPPAPPTSGYGFTSEIEATGEQVKHLWRFYHQLNWRFMIEDATKRQPSKPLDKRLSREQIEAIYTGGRDHALRGDIPKAAFRALNSRLSGTAGRVYTVAELESVIRGAFNNPWNCGGYGLHAGTVLEVKTILDEEGRIAKHMSNDPEGPRGEGSYVWEAPCWPNREPAAKRGRRGKAAHPAASITEKWGQAPAKARLFMDDDYAPTHNTDTPPKAGER